MKNKITSINDILAVGRWPLAVRNFGFTLIELLVVVLIIGILAAIALPKYTRSVQAARNAEIITNVSNLERAMELQTMTRGEPVNDLALLDYGFTNATDTPCVPGGGTAYVKSYKLKDICYFISTHPDAFFKNHVIGWDTKGKGNVFLVYKGQKYCAAWVSQAAKDECIKISGTFFKNINSNSIYTLK